MMLHDGQNMVIPNDLDGERKPNEVYLDNLLNVKMENGTGSTTDRSSASPSNVDDMMEDDVNQTHKEDSEDDDDEEEEEEEMETNNNVHSNNNGIINDRSNNIDNRMTGMENQFMYLQHQLARIMRQLHVTPCSCESCTGLHQSINGVMQLNDSSQMLSQLFPNATSEQLNTLLELSKINKLPTQVVVPSRKDNATPLPTQQSQLPPTSTSPVAAVAPPPPQQQAPLQPQANLNSIQMPSAAMNMLNGQNLPLSAGGGKMMVERERGASESRKAIVEFAKNHGGAAAAKKFGFPPPVATYYQRKESSHAIVNTPLASIPQLSVASSTASSASFPSIQAPNSATTSPGPSSDGGDRDDHPDTPQNIDSSMPTTPSIGNPPIFTQSMVDMLKMNANAAHSTGSPGFLRGRGRGRPKLIGDELDADLVDYMVQVKQTDAHGHLTASQALHIAKQYILEKAPGLLEEHGGHVKLKLTWAMKLVSRIAERQKEIEYGLPAGTLSNMGRNLGSLPGGSFMADVMAQNLFSQHLMMVNQANGGGNPDGKAANGVKNEMAMGKGDQKQDEKRPNEENYTNTAAISDIVNIKELNLPFLNNFLAELNDKHATRVTDGEIANHHHHQHQHQFSSI